MDQRATVVGHGFRLLCSDLDESDDDVLSVGPKRPLATAAPLGGARRNDDGMIQVNSLSDEWSVDYWTAEDQHGTCCAQLDDFDWVIPAGDLVGRLPRPEEDEELSNIELDVCEVPDEFFWLVWRRRLWSRCAFLWSFRRDRRGALTQSCPCQCARARISWRTTVRLL